MKRIRVNASTPYDIIIDKGILSSSGKLCRETLGLAKVAIVTDDKVAPLYLADLTNSLIDEGYEVVSYILPNGESSKNAENLISILEFLAENELTRKDFMIALGGGVVGDICGFASAIYLRGIRFVQIPTTLLAAVDSSVGGKTAVDLKAGKNLAGAFHQPSLVICDHSTLDTLDTCVFSDGCAEVIKYGVINDRAFFDSLKEGIKNNIETVIAECVSNKARIVENDELDKGERQLLNLGHTVGHAIELCSGLTLSHGSAVAIGMVIVTRAAVKLGLCPEADLDELICLLESVSLPISCGMSAEELTEVALKDKKRMGGTITLIVPHGIGNTKLYPIPTTELCDFIRKGL